MGDTGLKRELGLLRATMMGVGASICAGVFVMLGRATAMAGPAIIVVLLLCGLVNLLTMCSFCELGAALPRAGGEYTFVKTAFGGLMAFVTGWFEWISEMFYAALMAIGSAVLLSYFIPVNTTITAIVLVFVFTLINIRGAKETGTVATVLALTLLAALVMFIVAGFQHGFRADAFHPFAPNGVFGVIGATAYIFIVYLGAEDIVAAQGEIKDPSKNIPRAILLSAGILIAVYCTIAYVAVGIVSPEVLGEVSTPLAFVAERSMGWVGAVVITVAGIVAALSSLNTAIMAQSRVAYAMSRDGYFPKPLSKIHSRFGTPHAAVFVGSVFTLMFASVGVVDLAGYAADFGFLVGFCLVNLSLIRLRRVQPYLKRPFKTPLYPLTPILGIVASVFLMAFIETSVLTIGVELSVLALLAYYLSMIGYHRIRIAVGGMNLGIGILILLSPFFIKAGLISLTVPTQFTALLHLTSIFVGIICILAGILNVTVSSRSH